MKKAIAVVLTAACITTLPSCGILSRLYTTALDRENVILFEETQEIDDHGEIYSDTVIDESHDTYESGNTGETVAAFIPEADENMLTSDITELPDDVNVYYFADGLAAVVYSDKYAWVFDFAESKVVPIVDREAMLAVADPIGRAGEYFDDVVISYEFSESERELTITMTVTSNTADAEYKVYCFYTLNPLSFQERGFRGYYLLSVSYPGCDEPVSVDSIERIDELGVGKELWIYEPVRALVTNDIPALEAALYLEEGVLESWNDMEISKYTIIRDDVTSPWIDYLVVEMTVEKSNVEKLPAGRYRVHIYEGIGTEIDIECLSIPTEKRELNEAEEWLLPWAESFGGYFAPEDQIPEYEPWLHQVLDFYGYRCRVEDTEYSYEDFKNFCLYTFGIEDITVYYAKETDVTEYGGHGGSTYLCEIVNDFTASGIHFITVDFFADPMRTVVAFTQEYVITEANDTFRIDEVRRTYDSGFRPHGWTV